MQRKCGSAVDRSPAVVCSLLFCRDGAAHLDQVCTIRSQLPSSVPIIANGNVISWSDVGSNRRLTGCQGIMSAEGLLDDPSLFNGGVTVDRTRLAMEYLDLVDQYPTTLKTVIFHVRRMCKEVLQRYQLLEDCLSASSVEEVRGVVQKAIDYDMRGKGKGHHYVSTGISNDPLLLLLLLLLLRRVRHDHQVTTSSVQRRRRLQRRRWIVGGTRRASGGPTRSGWHGRPRGRGGPRTTTCRRVRGGWVTLPHDAAGQVIAIW